MQNIKPNLNPQLNIDILTNLAGIDRADRWLQVALPIARNHPEYADAIEQQVDNKFTGYELEKIRRQFEVLHAEAGIAQLFKELSQKSLAATIVNITENIASAVPVEECPQVNEIAGDPELVRLAIGLKESSQIRLWLVLLQIVRNINQNRILRVDLDTMLPTYGIDVSERNARRWLYRGHGLFWNLTEKYIYFAGYKTVAKRLVKLAVKHNLTNLIGTNRPGKRGMYIDVSGSLQQFEANVYAAWYASRENPTIARSTLSALWNREPRILRKWEKLAGVEVVTNEAQYHPEHFAEVPEHAYMYQAAIGQGRSETRFRARMVNSYHAPSIRQHGKRGQSRRVFHAVGKYLESIEPAGNCEQGSVSNDVTGGLKPTGRRYFADGKRARSSAKRHGDRQRYIVLGMNKHRQTIWDYAPDGVQRTTVGEELPLIAQRKFTSHRTYAKDVIYA